MATMALVKPFPSGFQQPDQKMPKQRSGRSPDIVTFSIMCFELNNPTEKIFDYKNFRVRPEMVASKIMILYSQFINKSSYSLDVPFVCLENIQLQAFAPQAFKD